MPGKSFLLVPGKLYALARHLYADNGKAYSTGTVLMFLREEQHPDASPGLCGHGAFDMVFTFLYEEDIVRFNYIHDRSMASSAKDFRGYFQLV